jgi:hypothetical protein
MRTILAPGIEWKEIDKSGYSPAMTGTGCLVPGFTDKGEPYLPMEFTSRAAWISYYGEPKNEAERYAYAAANEVLNQGGRLFFSRLPYDNTAFEKVVGMKYKLVADKYVIKYDPADPSKNTPFWEIQKADSTIDQIAAIEPAQQACLYDLSAIDEYRTDEVKVAADTFMIADIAFNTYDKVPEDTRKNEKREMIGIMPVITTAANAMYAQRLIEVDKACVIGYETVGKIRTLNAAMQLSAGYPALSVLTTNEISAADMARLVNTKEYYQLVDKINLRKLVKTTKNYATEEDAQTSGLNDISAELHNIGFFSTDLSTSWNGKDFQVIEEMSSHYEVGVSILSAFTEAQVSADTDYKEDYAAQDWKTTKFGYHNPDGDDTVPKTVSQEANGMFPTIGFDGEKFERDNLKKIGVIVYKLFLDPSEGNKINFEAVESYAGSLCKTDKDPNTGVTTFIDTIINSQSKFINFFSNCFNTQVGKKYYADKLDLIVVQPGSKGHADSDATAKVTDTVCPSMGFFSALTKKDISISKSIYDGLNKVFEKNQDILERQIDIVPDAGIANIASYLKAIYGDKGEYDLGVTDDLGNSLLGMWKCDSNNTAIKTWKTVEQKFDNFCKNIRKDCMFIADGPRPLVLSGQKKIIRPSKPANTIDVNIIPNIKWVTGLNTSYGAMYVDWFEQADDYSGDFFWCPPSIKAMGVYINTDVNYNYWDAPAGLNRGVIAATDVAFSPTIKQAGCFYEKNLNYAIQYPNDGIVLEGQKTLQAKPSAFDRVNVRRLFLRLERQSFIASRYFVYEGNTAYLRQRLIDALDPYFKDAKNNGGIYDYKIKCDESNNPPSSIDRNELHVSIGIKPVKTAEFILIDFVALSTGGSWEEAGF